MQTKPQLTVWICAALFVSPLPASAEYLPHDMQIFVDKREGCDGIRRAEVAPRNLSKLCAGTDKELAQLRRKYAANSTITQILNQFEPSIEAFEAPAPKRKTGHRPNKKETETTTYK